MNATKRLCVAGLGLLALVLPGAALAAGTGGGMLGGGRNDRNSGNTRNPKYCVVVAKGIDGSLKFESMAVDQNFFKELRDRQKGLTEEFEKAAVEWKEGAAKAAKEHVKYTEAKPRPPAIQKYKDEKTKSSYAKQEDAKAAAEAVQKKFDELQAAIEAKKAAAELKAASGDKAPAPKKEE